MAEAPKDRGLIGGDGAPPRVNRFELIASLLFPFFYHLAGGGGITSYVGVRRLLCTEMLARRWSGGAEVCPLPSP